MRICEGAEVPRSFSLLSSTIPRIAVPFIEKLFGPVLDETYSRCVSAWKPPRFPVLADVGFGFFERSSCAFRCIKRLLAFYDLTPQKTRLAFFAVIPFRGPRPAFPTFCGLVAAPRWKVGVFESPCSFPGPPLFLVFPVIPTGPPFPVKSGHAPA